MRLNVPNVATHLLESPDEYITPLGCILRKTSMDEIPQIWSILKGDMALVGPRPALHNQYDLKDMRTQVGIHRLTQGITGWAQISGRDDLPSPQKVEMDMYYLKNHSCWMDLKILWGTIIAVIGLKGISH